MPINGYDKADRIKVFSHRSTIPYHIITPTFKYQAEHATSAKRFSYSSQTPMLSELSFTFCIISSCGQVLHQPVRDTEKDLPRVSYPFVCTHITYKCLHKQSSKRKHDQEEKHESLSKHVCQDWLR